MPNKFKYAEPGLRLSRTVTDLPDPGRFFMHTHPHLEVYCFLRGRGVFHIEGGEYPLEPGDVLIMHPAESHYIDLDCTLPYERMVLEIAPDYLQTLDPAGWLTRPFRERPPGRFNLYKSGEFPGGSLALWQTMMAPEGDRHINVLSGLIPLLNRICQLWQVRSDEADAHGETTQYRIIRYVNRNLTGQLSLDSICEKFYISKSQLGRLFKKATGSTLWQYVTIKRLALARQLLDQGEHPTHIYSRCGFTDYSTFYRAYKKTYGTAPGADSP